MNVLITTPFGRLYVPGVDEVYAGHVLSALANTIVLGEGPEYGALDDDPVNSRLSILGRVEIRPPLEIDAPLAPLYGQLISSMIEQKRQEANQIQKIAGNYASPVNMPAKGNH